VVNWLIIIRCVKGGYVEYCVLDAQDEKIGSRVLFTGIGINFRLCYCGMAIICIVKNLRNLYNNSRKTKGHGFNNCTELNNIK